MVLGDKLTLTCKFSESTSKIEWKKNDAPEIPRATISEEDHQSTLVIEKVDIGDSGDYSCVAHNQAGYGFSTIKIKVRGKTLSCSFSGTFIANNNLNKLDHCKNK